jgi:polyisoprenoid-binding protein YceI
MSNLSYRDFIRVTGECFGLKLLRTLIVSITMLLTLSGTALSDEHPLPRWQLPLELSKENTSVTFKVDTTWHMVEGKVADVVGKVWQEDPRDNGTVHASVKLAVKDFDTGNVNRDKKLRSVMHAAVHPQVIFEMDHVSGLCTFEELERLASKTCSGAGHGFIEISSARRPVILDMTIVRKDTSYLITGHTFLKWSDFGVEDPSILVAYVNEAVNIEVEVAIPVRSADSKDK